jgi:CRP-like cAMP-binding protein
MTCDDVIASIVTSPTGGAVGGAAPPIVLAPPTAGHVSRHTVGVQSCTFVPAISAPTGGLSGFIGHLPRADRERLLALGTRRRYRRGTPLFFEGDRSDYVLVVLEGRVRVSIAGADGRDLVIAVRGPGDLLGEFAAIERGMPRSASAHAIEPLLVQVVTAEEFEAFLEKSPRAAVTLLRTLTRRLRETSRAQMEFGSYDTIGRVARRLDELVAEHGEQTSEGVRIALPLTQEELAGWVGASRESVARALRSLRDRGVISTSRRSVVVHDHDALARYTG